ncbi:MAG: hypothetical protein E7256_01430 [Lachnospiraceae bacterium]|nr:hypothetical protein [Lachnospiraceae bacterium]
MRNKVSNVLWGVFWIVLGVGIAGNAFHIWDFTLFFRGWWTLFIIVPCAISMINNGFGNGSMIGLVIGILLLLAQRNILDGSVLRKLIVPIILVLIGINIMFRGIFTANKKMHLNVEFGPGQNAIFGGKTQCYTGEIFRGTEANAIFGGVKLDLRDAQIPEDAVIDASAIFGGIDIFVPQDIRVKVSSTSLFGGTTNHVKGRVPDDAKTIYINTTCMFGGVDIR